jgi:hypothetical protein
MTCLVVMGTGVACAGLVTYRPKNKGESVVVWRRPLAATVLAAHATLLKRRIVVHKSLVRMTVRAPRLTRLVQTPVIRVRTVRLESYDTPGCCLEWRFA